MAYFEAKGCKNILIIFSSKIVEKKLIFKLVKIEFLILPNSNFQGRFFAFFFPMIFEKKWWADFYIPKLQNKLSLIFFVRPRTA